MTNYCVIDTIHQLRGDTISGFSIDNIKIDEVAIDLANYTVKMQVREKNRRVILDFTLGDGIIETDSNSIFIEPFIIEKVGVFKYDIQFTNSESEVNTWFAGDIKITEDITD